LWVRLNWHRIVNVRDVGVACVGVQTTKLARWNCWRWLLFCRAVSHSVIATAVPLRSRRSRASLKQRSGITPHDYVSSDRDALKGQRHSSRLCNNVSDVLMQTRMKICLQRFITSSNSTRLCADNCVWQ